MGLSRRMQVGDKTGEKEGWKSTHEWEGKEDRSGRDAGAKEGPRMGKVGAKEGQKRSKDEQERGD